MLGYKPTDIQLVDLSNKGDRDVEEGIISMAWDELAQVMTRHDIRSNKDGPCFMPVMMKPVEDWVLSRPRRGTKPGYRNDQNVAAVTMVVLDLDRPGSREQAEKAFHGWEYVLYSTHSRCIDTPEKYRVILPLDQPIPTKDWPPVFALLSEMAGADSVCSNTSRIYYYPSANPSAGIAPISRHHRGSVLSAKKLIAEGYKKLKNSHAARRYNPAAQIGVPRPEAPHFAGTSNEPNPIHYRIEALETRHARSIEKLREEDSRHHFAMSVIARELARFGARTDLNRLFQFLFYAADQHSSRGLETGNTIEEIPELVESAWAKFVGSGHALAEGALQQAINDGLHRAFSAMRSGRWEFYELNSQPPVVLVPEKRDADPVENAISLVNQCVRKLGSQARLAPVAAACLATIDRADIDGVAEKLLKSADRIRPEAGPWSEEQFRRFWRGALTRAVAQARKPESDPPGFAI